MHLVSLEVKGLKSLRDTKIEGLEHYNVFIGKNNSGKSTVLQAVGLLNTLERQLADDEAPEVLTDRSQSGSLLFSATFRLSESELGGLVGAESLEEGSQSESFRVWRYDFEMRVGDDLWTQRQLYLLRCGFMDEEHHTPFMQLRDVQHPEGGYNTLTPDHVGGALAISDVPVEATLSRYLPGASRVGTPIRANSRGVQEEFYIEFLRGFLAKLRRVDAVRAAEDEMGVASKVALDSSGADLTQVLETWRSSYPERFAVIEGLARDMFPDILRVHLPREGENTIVRIASRGDPGPLAAFRLSQVGMGVQQALMVASAVVAAEAGGVLLVEEPENNLHAGAQRVLAEWLRKHAVENDKQILLTTHSTIFASTEEHCSIYLVRLDEKEGTNVTKLEAGHQPLVKEELGIRNVDLYGYNGVVLWEGDSEDQAMPLLLEVLAEQAGTSLHALGLTSRNLYGHTNTRLRAVRQFLRLLDDLDIAPYVIMDDDEGVRKELAALVQEGLLPDGHYHVWEDGRKTQGRNPEVACEFEDNFSDEQLVEAAVAVAADAGESVDLTAAGLTSRLAESAKKTSDVLCKYYWQETEYGLRKPELNSKLAEMVAPELAGKTERTVKEYEFERVARDIFAKLGGMR